MQTNIPSADDLGVILGGGGVAGLAWEIGLLTGIEEAGVDLRQAREVIGTSAGAFAAVAWLGHSSMDVNYQLQLANAVAEVSASFSLELAEQYKNVFEATTGNPKLAGRLLGQIARKAKTIEPAMRFAIVRDRLGIAEWPDAEWPDLRLSITAIDADTGDLVKLRHTSGLTLEEATAASGAIAGVWPLVEAGGRSWIDGGMVSAANTALASAFSRSVVIAPAPRNLTGLTVQEEVKSVMDDTDIFLIVPDDQSIEAIGDNPLDQTKRRPAATAGRRQGLAVATQLKAWLAEDYKTKEEVPQASGSL
ncbi:patatin-like phospholipase family protein [Pseudarthrobacter sp. SL88]|uniref:patatin-like phospholipase family protein n=1 Tax=Pseudarthrobacter sp. SL88 TaxID=2994666 RepID=UPI002272BAC0|nr:patatin-like phospholipase family protein [Pseudarthrobacter sp. SL88]MCY1676508.1 patatin-like phospholipase family protein [Pseudarthrobacter sp. SL88]